MNLQQYGDHRKALGLKGTSHVAVLKAIERGRLMPPAVERNGRSLEINPELADQQWADATHPAQRGSGHHQGHQPVATEPAKRAPAQRQETSTPKGGLCVEPFGGSGSTLMGAERTSRVCYAMELTPAYVDVIVKRWQQFTGKTAKLEGSGKPFPAEA